MKYIAENWHIVFGGVGTAVLAAIVGAWAKAYFEGRKKAAPSKSGVTQSINSGQNSTNVQATRDANVDVTRK